MSDEKVEMWGLLDLFGHVKLAGKIGEYALGASHSCIDIPQVDEIPAHTRLFGKGAIYGLSFVGREIAEAAARKLRSEPISIYDFDSATRSRMSAVPAIRNQKSVLDEDDPSLEFESGFDGDSDITNVG